MKHILTILPMLAMLAALPASPAPAWSQKSDSEKCMDYCLEPTLEYCTKHGGDSDVIEEALRQCLAQCHPEAPGNLMFGSANSFTPYGSIEECLVNCASKYRQCLRLDRTPKKCNIEFDKCWSKCLH